MNLLELSEPLPLEAIHWRAQSVTSNGDRALALAYIDARDVMDRLDAVCGPAGWQTYYDETPTGRVLCKLSILVDGEWICKTDGAGSTAVEGEKGGISDALKRAAVAWGIGRYLYDLGNVWAPCESRKDGNRHKWVKWKPEAERVFASALRGLAIVQTKITEAQQTELMAHLDAMNLPVAEFLNVSKITDLRQLPADKFDGAKGWITKNAKQKETA